MHQIMRQPDGRLAVWSTIVGKLVVCDATPVELAEWFAGQAAEAARVSARLKADAVAAGKEAYPPNLRREWGLDLDLQVQAMRADPTTASPAQ